MTADKYTVHVYLDDGRVFYYQVPSADKAREHSAAIVAGGYRHSPEGEDLYEHYGPHRIAKVKVTGAVPTNYPDRSRGT
jgi:hypothetical protein